MSSSIIFLTIEEVVELHSDVLAMWGGADGARDMGAVESAVAQPCAEMFGAFLHDDLFHMAAAYAFHIAEAQGFLDGNKRTGAAAALTFLDMNGINYGSDVRQEIYDALIAIAEHRLDKSGLAELFRELRV